LRSRWKITISALTMQGNANNTEHLFETLHSELLSCGRGKQTNQV
jgi:hypothetical protein